MGLSSLQEFINCWRLLSVNYCLQEFHPILDLTVAKSAFDDQVTPVTLFYVELFGVFFAKSYQGTDLFFFLLIFS